jgi:acid phosphatase (class A)
MQRTRTDAGRATHRAKNHYQRLRPFAVNKDGICTRDDEYVPKKNDSFPSSHASIGWAWALILTEIAPDRADAILARGYAFGQSRVICGVHWQSDVTAGRTVGAAVVARLHAEPEFRTQLEAARTELAAARAKAFKPTRDCGEEARALAFRPPRLP